MKDSVLPTRQIQVSTIKSLFDDMIDRHAEAYLAAYPEVKEFSNFEKSGTSNYYIGMVWTNDFERPQQELNTIRVRGSKSLTNNKLVELDLNSVLNRCIEAKLQESFFPGQIVAFKAEPFLKRQLNVLKFLDPVGIAPPLKSIHTHDKIVLAAASGPFMKPDQDDWTLYEKLIASVREHGVTHLILTGPIVDLGNKFCKANYEAHWRSAIDKLLEGLHNHECHVYIVPSSRDILPSSLGVSYVYPCPRLNLKLGIKEEADVKCKIHRVADPSQIDIDGIFVDVTSADVAFHLSRCISFLNRVDNMLTTVFRHIIVHGMYPIYPSHQDIAIDYPSLREFIQLDRLGAHILVLPNQLGVTSVHSVADRLVLATKRCSLGKQLLIVEIPATSGAGDIGEQLNSVADERRHSTKIIDLIPKISNSQSGGSEDCAAPSSSTPPEGMVGVEEMAAPSSEPGQDSPALESDTR